VWLGAAGCEQMLERELAAQGLELHAASVCLRHAVISDHTRYPAAAQQQPGTSSTRT